MSSIVGSEANQNRLSRLLILGPPGSGKRTQGVALAQQLELPALSTGELFPIHDVLRHASGCTPP